MPPTGIGATASTTCGTSTMVAISPVWPLPGQRRNRNSRCVCTLDEPGGRRTERRR
jgi:hypothetical protein